MNDRYLDAQLSVLGAVLIDDSTVGKVIHRTQEEDFTGSYRTVYKAIKSIFLSGKPVDLTTVSAALGADYDKLLLQIMELTPTAANVDVYIDLTLEQAQLMRLKAAGETLQTCTTLDDARAVVGKINRGLGTDPVCASSPWRRAFRIFMSAKRLSRSSCLGASARSTGA